MIYFGFFFFFGLPGPCSTFSDNLWKSDLVVSIQKLFFFVIVLVILIRDVCQKFLVICL